jgi:hypothetical protein
MQQLLQAVMADLHIKVQDLAELVVNVALYRVSQGEVQPRLAQDLPEALVTLVVLVAHLRL